MARKILIDGGAHCGCTRRFFRKNFDKKHQYEIYSFEPDTDFNKYCPHLINEAIWTSNVIKDYNKFGISGGSTLEIRKANKLEEQVERYRGTRQIVPVRCFDIDQWIKNTFEPHDYIILKLDIEGGEYTVLPHMIKNGSIKYINRLLIEWHNIRCGIPKSVDDNLRGQMKHLTIGKWDAMQKGYCMIRGKIIYLDD